MKLIISILMLVLISSMAYAVGRGVSGTTITYSTDDSFTASLTKAYWAVEDTLSGSGCSLDDISATSCGTNCEYSISGDVLRLVVYPPDESGTVLGDTRSVSVTGSGTGCTLSGSYAEAPGSTAAVTSMSGGDDTIDFGAASCPIYGDTYPACDGIQRTELGTVAAEWMANPTSALRASLGAAAQNWIDNGGPA